ncbi:MAG: glycoside hydrolase family protein [Deltaproteobacteria bacterium]|nr:glycoside hydrolase family protein [Deltaproteobacteria bacterium]
MVLKVKSIAVLVSIVLAIVGQGCADDKVKSDSLDADGTASGTTGAEDSDFEDSLTGGTDRHDDDTNIAAVDTQSARDSDTDAGGDSETTSSHSDGPSRSCKRGVAYGHHAPADMAALSPGVSWWYNWYYAPDSELGDDWQKHGVTFVPMWWGDKIPFIDVENGVPSKTGAILGFNEPNFFSQANLSAGDAAALWPQLQAFADENDLAIGAPAVNFCGGGCHSTGPVAWLNEFFDACTDCRVDFIAVHIYVECNADSPGLSENRAQWLINHMEMYIDAFDRPIWLTEFACSGNPSLDEQKAFLVDAVDWLENEPRVARYAWFAGRADNMANVDLLGVEGQLTALGESYVNAPHTQECR